MPLSGLISLVSGIVHDLRPEITIFEKSLILVFVLCSESLPEKLSGYQLRTAGSTDSAGPSAHIITIGEPDAGCHEFIGPTDMFQRKTVKSRGHRHCKEGCQYKAVRSESALNENRTENTGDCATSGFMISLAKPHKAKREVMRMKVKRYLFSKILLSIGPTY